MANLNYLIGLKKNNNNYNKMCFSLQCKSELKKGYKNTFA